MVAYELDEYLCVFMKCLKLLKNGYIFLSSSHGCQSDNIFFKMNVDSICLFDIRKKYRLMSFSK